MRPKLLIVFCLFVSVFVLPGCAALWVADKAVDATLFAVGTTAKVGATAAQVTWDTGAAVGDMAVPDEEEMGEKQNP